MFMLPAHKSKSCFLYRLLKKEIISKKHEGIMKTAEIRKLFLREIPGFEMFLAHAGSCQRKKRGDSVAGCPSRTKTGGPNHAGFEPPILFSSVPRFQTGMQVFKKICRLRRSNPQLLPERHPECRCPHRHACTAQNRLRRSRHPAPSRRMPGWPR